MIKPSIIKKTLLLALLLPFTLYSQSYLYQQYGVNEGLPTNIVKATTQDSLGYFWIASDEAITRFDGNEFLSYPNKVNNKFFKGFLNLTGNRLLAFGDLDFIEINNLGDDISFKEFYSLGRNPNDTVISYPKSIYKDKNNSIWIGETQSVVKITNDKIERHTFSIEDRTNQFLRSFEFFEDQAGILYTVSVIGNVYSYNPSLKTWEKYPINFPLGVEYVGVYDHQILIGATNGIYTSQMIDSTGFQVPILKKDIHLVSSIAKVNDKYVVATRGQTHYITNEDLSDFQPLPFSINDVNHIYISKENDIWLSSNDGLILIKENHFHTFNDGVNGFIETVTENLKTGEIYYANNEFLVTHNKNHRSEAILNIVNGYFQSIVYTNEGLWIANAFKIFFYQDGVIKKEFDFSDKKLFITDITLAPNGSLWLTIPETATAYEITKDFELKTYPISLCIDGVINIIDSDANGTYIGASGCKYLFYKSNNTDEFQNLSPALELNKTPSINSFLFNDSSILMGSSEGLLILKEKRINKVDIGEKFENLSIHSLTQYDDDRILFANNLGLIAYNVRSQVSDLFNEGHGLPSRTISQNSIHVDSKKRIWVGTSNGIAFSNSTLTNTHKTNPPRITHVTIDGLESSSEKISSQFGDFITIDVSSITFPENDVIYQYRIQPSTNWNTFQSKFNLSDLKSGDYLLELRAKKYGPFSWSEVTNVELIVGKPFWLQLWFIACCITFSIGIVLITLLIVDIRNKKHRRHLEKLIKEKINEVSNKNQHLKELNQEKNSLISIVAHDLKSPLSQINLLVDIIKKEANTLTEEIDRSLDLIKSTVFDLNNMIIRILDVNKIESQKIEIKKETIDLTKTLEKFFILYDSVSMEKQIRLNKAIDKGVFVNLDKDYLLQIIDNLLSNAFKFTEKEREITIALNAEKDMAIIEIRDQGPGITNEDKSRIFGKYQKLSAKPTGNESSTGLGLSIVKKYVEAMNGKIWFESEVGKGTSFFVSFPKSGDN